jgi:putative transposase
MSKFKNKYRNESARASWWNYSNNGAYFITIWCVGGECIFGEISNKEMYLSPIGEIVYQEWNISFDMRTELFCDAFVIMPNHIHAILRIDNDIPADGMNSNNLLDIVGTHGRASLQGSNHKFHTEGIAYRSPKSISSFVAGFKSAATKRINEHRNSPQMQVWQKRFHDHIIRNDIEYNRIFDYILNNVENWDKDSLYRKDGL